MTDISPAVRSALEAATIRGTQLVMPPLDRRTYVEANKVLDAAGGRWSRRDGAHLFAGDPAVALAGVLDSGTVPLHPRQAEGYVATPSPLAATIVGDHTDVPALPRGRRVLEPSAGDGALVRAIGAVNPAVEIVAVEPNAQRAAGCADDSGRVQVVTATLEEFAGRRAAERPFAAVVMNPPFSLPGARTVWIDHVLLAWELLGPGGRLTAIVPAGALFRDDRRHRRIRDLLDAHGYAEPLPDRAFAAAGTAIKTVVISLTKR